MSLRECPVPNDLLVCETPEQAAAYWRLHLETHPYFNPECECFVVLLLNTRKRVKGHQLVTIGTMDTLLVHAREVFRTAIVSSAASVLLLHNHPSGEPGFAIENGRDTAADHITNLGAIQRPHEQQE